MSILENFTEPLTKLLEMVANTIGVIYKPVQIRREAKAQGDASIILAEANAKVKEIELRTRVRLDYIENRRQKNLDQIINKSTLFLPSKVDNKPLDEDWTVQFFDYCKDISNEEMQTIWSRLLAGEVSHPGTYSPRTLFVLKHMRKEDAEIFTKFCSFVWRVDGTLLGRFRISGVHELAENVGLNSYSLTQLDNLGLVKYNYFHKTINDADTFVAEYLGHKVLFELPKKIDTNLVINGYSTLHIDSLTDVGSELFTLCGPEYNEVYFNVVVKYFENLGASSKQTN